MRTTFLWMMLLMLCSCLSVLAAPVGDGAFYLQDVEQYTYVNGRYERACVGPCIMTFSLCKPSAAIDPTFSFTSVDAHGVPVAITEVAHTMELWDITPRTAANGSLEPQRAPSSLEDINQDTSTQAVGQCHTYEYRFQFTHADTAIDIVPVYNTHAYTEYVFFTSADLGGNLLLYWSNDVDATTNHGFAGWLSHVVNTPTVHNTTDGLRINESYNFLAQNLTAHGGIDLNTNTLVGNSFTPSSNTTQSAWLRLDTNASVLGHRQLYWFINTNDRYMGFIQAINNSWTYIYSDLSSADHSQTLSPDYFLTDFRWHFYVMRYIQAGTTSANVEFWRDLQLIHNLTISIVTGNPLDASACGATDFCDFFQNAGTESLNATIDEFRLYNVSLSLSQMQELYAVVANISPSFDEVLLNETRVNGTYSFQHNWSATNDALETSNDTRWSIVTNNITQTSTVTWTIPGFSGTVFTQYNISNQDGSSVTYQKIVFVPMNFSPQFVDPPAVINMTAGTPTTAQWSWTATLDADTFTNDTNVQVVTNNVSRTVNATYSYTVAGVYTVAFNISNIHGSDVHSQQVVVNAVPITNGSSGNGTNVNVSVNVDLTVLERRTGTLLTILLLGFAEYTRVSAIQVTAGVIVFLYHGDQYMTTKERFDFWMAIFGFLYMSFVLFRVRQNI